MTLIKLNGKSYRVASCWEEVTVNQYVRILLEWEPEKDIADRDYFILLNILANENFSGYENTIDNQVTLTNILGWVITQPFEFSKKLPRALQIGDQTVTIPEDPRELSIGQNIHLRRDFIDKSKILEENMSIATAIYLQPILDKSLFHVKRAIELSRIIDEMPISVIYPVGFFLLKRAMGFGMRPVSYWQAVKISLKKMSKNLFPGWLRSNGYTGTKTFR